MASPKLDSAPPSPPRPMTEILVRQPSPTKARSPPPAMIGTALSPFPSSALEETGLRPRSPRTSTPSQFSLDVSYPSSLVPGGRASPKLGRESDVEQATPRGSMTTPRILSTDRLMGSPRTSCGPINMPSLPIARAKSMPSNLSRSMMRLVLFCSLILSCMFVLVSYPSTRLPSLRTAAVSKRLALASNGRAYYEALHPVESWSDARERDYVPPQIKAHHMMKRAEGLGITVAQPTAPAPPKTDRTRMSNRPLPSTHELLALQSYLLQSTTNYLPSNIDPHRPLDANIVLGYDVDEAALRELERERVGEVIVWYGGDGVTHEPHEHLNLLSALHGPSHKPTLLPIHGRPDTSILVSIFSRLNLPIRHHPIVVIGNKAFVADMDRMEEMRGSGQLRTMLDAIGWQKDGSHNAVAKKEGWKPKLAKWTKTETTEVERAWKEAREAGHLKAH